MSESKGVSVVGFLDGVLGEEESCDVGRPTCMWVCDRGRLRAREPDPLLGVLTRRPVAVLGRRRRWLGLGEGECVGESRTRVVMMDPEYRNGLSLWEVGCLRALS